MVRPIVTALLTGVPFGVGLGAFLAVRYGSVLGLEAGVFGGLFFGASLSAFLEVQRRRMSNAELGEPVIHSGPANHLRNLEAVGGWLYLTPSRLLFRPHRFNVQTRELAMPRSEIVAVERRQTALIMPNGIEVRLKTGPERFVVQGRAGWISAICKNQPGPRV